MDFSINIVLLITLLVMVAIGALLVKNSRNQGLQKDKLQKLNADLTDLDAKKNEFLSFATHQLRSPLTSIKWGLDALKENFSPEVVDHLLTTTNDLIGTVNDLLDISKIEQGGMVMKKEEFDLHDFVGRIVEEFRMTAEAKHLKLVFQGTNAPCFIDADQNKLRQVFVNLIDNAIKYTKDGSITVSFRTGAHDAVVEISDTGPGIDPKELSELFDKFLRGKAGKASQGGSGLGLYLAKRIVEFHNGSIAAHSAGAGKGSTFKVMLPFKG
jgi:signal transduction histidine kinase